LKTHDLEFASDVKLVADGCGDPSSRAVIFLHGGGQTRHAWRSILRKVSDMGLYAVSVDLRGHGDSGWAPGGDYDDARFVDDIECMVSRFAVPPVLVGASLGGLMGIRYAGSGRRPIAGLALIDCVPRLHQAGVARIGSFMRAHPQGFASIDEAADAVAQYRTNHQRPSNTSGLMKNLRRGSDGRLRWHWDPRFMEGLKRRTSQDALETAAARITVPTLLLRGQLSDVVTPAGVEQFRALVPQTEFVEIAGADHMLTGDLNSPYDREVIAFLKRHFGAGADAGAPARTEPGA